MIKRGPLFLAGTYAGIFSRDLWDVYTMYVRCPFPSDCSCIRTGPHSLVHPENALKADRDCAGVTKEVFLNSSLTSRGGPRTQYRYAGDYKPAVTPIRCLPEKLAKAPAVGISAVGVHYLRAVPKLVLHRLISADYDVLQRHLPELSVRDSWVQ